MCETMLKETNTYSNEIYSSDRSRGHMSLFGAEVQLIAFGVSFNHNL